MENHKVYQAHKIKGGYCLIPDTLIKEYARESRLLSRGNRVRMARLLCRFLANLCFCRGYDSIEEINYSLDGNPSRVFVILHK